MLPPRLRALRRVLLVTLVCFACSLHDGGNDGVAEDLGSSTSRYLVVISGAGNDDFITGTMELDLTSGVIGTIRLREGEAVPDETSVSGSTTGSSGSLGWGSYTATFEIVDDRLAGTFGGPGGEGLLEGANATRDEARLLCGTYGGDDEGVWNFLVTDKGSVRGAFMGFFAAGSIDGNVTAGDELALTWFADEELSGSGDGSLDAGRAMGKWSGPDVAGTWASDETVCP
jgi:hypothetical protein